MRFHPLIIALTLSACASEFNPNLDNTDASESDGSDGDAGTEDGADAGSSDNETSGANDGGTGSGKTDEESSDNDSTVTGGDDGSTGTAGDDGSTSTGDDSSSGTGSSGSATLPPQCAEEPEVGPCDAEYPKYYFDPNSGTCKEFIWGGCDGNIPFETMEECRTTCEPTCAATDAPCVTQLCCSGICINNLCG